MKEKKAYYRRIEIIRDISCILVLLYHLQILKGGFLAVCIFFTLSGYLSCMSALKNKNFSIKSYYINRLKRLYLPLIVVVFGTVILVKFNSAINWINLKQETNSVVFGYNNFWQLNANLDYFTRNTNSPFTHLWYISILMQFDLIFPLVVVALRKVENKVKIHISTIIVGVLTIATTLLFYFMSKTEDIMVVYYNTFARSFSIFFGILLAIIHYKYKFKLSKIFAKFDTPLFTIYNLLLIGLCIFVSAESSNYAIYMILTTIITTRLIEYAIQENQKNGKYDKSIKLISKISYEIYLVQYPVIYFLQNTIKGDVLIVILSVILTFIISLILHLLLNFPLRRKILKAVKAFGLCLIIIYGSFIVITEKDYTVEMNELEARLNENAKIMQEKNKEYIETANQEEKEWNKTLENIESQEDKIEEEVRQLPVVGIGDSVLLGTIDELYKQFPNGYFDGKVSRTILQAEELINDLKSNGKLGDTLILTLANNGDYSDRINKGLMDILGDREIFWVNAVGADDPQFNDRFKEFAKDYHNIHIVEWDKAAQNHPEYFYADGVHVKEDGIKAYVDTIYKAIYDNYLEKHGDEKNKILQKHEEELKNKIAFYGNDVLINAFDVLNEKVSNANFNAKPDYTFDSLYEELKEKVENKKLEHQIMLLFDKKADFSENEYNKIIDLCKDYNIYLFNLTDENYSFKNENVKIINFYDKMKNNEDYTLADKVHLSEKGNEVFVDLICKVIEEIK